MDELRKKATEVLKKNKTDNNDLSLVELKQIMEELQVHQIELKLQNEELREKQITIEEARTKYFSLFNLAPVGYLVVDEKAIIHEINLKACEIFERQKDHLLSHPVISMLDSSYISDFYEYYDNVKNNKEVKPIELALRNKKGTLFIELTAKRYIEGLYLIIFMDITARKEIEQKLIEKEMQLRELNATKDKFFNIIAHDLRNPFSGIIGIAEMMESKIAEGKDKKLQEFLKLSKMIHNSSKQGFALLENLLQWSRSQTGNIDMNLHNFYLNDLLSEIIPIVSGNAFKKNITLENNIPKNEIVYADELLVNTILSNLVYNAIKFTNPKGKITLSSVRKEKLLEISVSDNGVGISPNNLEKIFRIDAKLSTIGTSHEKGTGLGLILCKEFAERLGGKIWVNSQLGVGTTFTFTLPLGI